MFRELIINDDMIKRARVKAQSMGILDNSITKGKGSVAGFVGEYLAQDVYGGILVNDFNYDLILIDGSKADVKTKQTSAIPLLNYECSIHKEGIGQECELYIFARVDITKRLGWVVGSITKESYFKIARELKRGDHDPDNDYYVKHDCYNISISDLKPPPKGIKKFEQRRLF